ncbi:MAG: hypothetical protein Q9163_000843 [Psora crenata]
MEYKFKTDHIAALKIAPKGDTEKEIDAPSIVGAEYFNLDSEELPLKDDSFHIFGSQSLVECDAEYPDIQPSPFTAEEDQMKEACASDDVANLKAVYGLYLQGTRNTPKDWFAGCYNIALSYNNASVARFLVEAGIPFNIFHFIQALDQKEYTLMKLYLDHEFDINQQLAWDEPGPLQLTFDDEKLTRWFLSHGAEPNSTANWTKLHFPLPFGKTPFAIIKLLFESRASVKPGQPLHYAARRESEDCIQVLDFLWEKMSPMENKSLNEVWYEHNPHSFELQKWRSLDTPLHEAVTVGSIGMIGALRAKGADVEIRDSAEKTALERAQRLGRTEIFDYFRKLP